MSTSWSLDDDAVEPMIQFGRKLGYNLIVVQCKYNE